MTLLYEMVQMLGAYKKHPQAYFLYVEDCFLLSDNADAPYISKGNILRFLFTQPDAVALPLK